MIPGITPIERAFELAKSGRCRTMAEIVTSLKAEGYATDQIDHGPGLRRQLQSMIKEAGRRERG